MGEKMFEVRAVRLLHNYAVEVNGVRGKAEWASYGGASNAALHRALIYVRADRPVLVVGKFGAFIISEGRFPQDGRTVDSTDRPSQAT